jgi:hypothetical protein
MELTRNSTDKRREKTHQDIELKLSHSSEQEFCFLTDKELTKASEV